MPALIQKSGSANEQVIKLGSELVIIGRNPSCKIRLDDPGVSRNHAEITHADGKWFVRDLGSSNGTIINDKLTRAQKVQINSGDVLRLGQTTFTFVDEVAVPPEEEDINLTPAEGIPMAVEASPDESIPDATEAPAAESIPMDVEAPKPEAPEPAAPADSPKPAPAPSASPAQKPAAARPAAARE
ncbi:MAG TPA: FHA domain-containing protein, partial [Planctomycetota bacterium]|nr:FHA domain-containing protein [Planctomycetota bacterium]